MPNWEDMARQMTVPFGGIQPQPQQIRPDMNAMAQSLGNLFGVQTSIGPSTATVPPIQMFNAWPESLAKGLVRGLMGIQKPPDTRSPEEKAYGLAEEAAMFGGGMSFKQSYPTFEIYKKAMADMKIPLDEVIKQRAKGPSYHSIPATEAEYMARVEKSSKKSTISQEWSSVRQAMNKIPKFDPGMGDTLAALHKQFPDMSKAEFDEMVLSLWREGKITLHQQDLPKGYKGEMIALPSKRVGDSGKIEDATDYYHYFTVKPEWR